MQDLSLKSINSQVMPGISVQVQKGSKKRQTGCQLGRILCNQFRLKVRFTLESKLRFTLEMLKIQEKTTIKRK